MTGKRASSWSEGTASRAVARMNARLKRGWAIDSWAQTNRVPSCTPAAPISRYDSIASPRPIPPATNTGTSLRCGKHFLCQHRGRDRPDMAAGLAALDDDRVGPGAHELAGDPRAGAKQMTRAPPSRRRWIAALAGMPPASTTCPTRRARQTSISSASCGCIVIRLTPNGFDGERRGGGDFGVEQIGRHRARRDHAETAGIRDRGDQVALRHPGHRAAHDRQLGAEKRAAARPQQRPVRRATGVARARHRRPDRAGAAARHAARFAIARAAGAATSFIRGRRARTPYAARAAPARCIRPRSAR